MARRAKALAKATPVETKKVSFTLPIEQAVVAKNSAYCPDRPPASEEITTGLPMAWSSPQEPPHPESQSIRQQPVGKQLYGGQGTTTDPTLFVIAHGISTDAMAAQELGVRVVGGSEIDPKLAAAFSQRTGAVSYTGLV